MRRILNSKKMNLIYLKNLYKKKFNIKMKFQFLINGCNF